MNNIEIINGIEVDWDKYKGGNRGKKGYIGLCELLHKNKHKLLSDYIDAKTNVLIDFNCGHKPHETTSNRYKKGKGCPKCAVIKNSEVIKSRSKDDLISLINKNGHKLLSEYEDIYTKVLIDFNCGHPSHWIAPNLYKTGKGCPECKADKLKKKGKEKLIEIINKNGHKLLSEYKGVKEKVLIKFNCDHKPSWIFPESYRRGQKCPKCSGVCPEQAKEKLIEIINKNGDELLSEYVNADTKILIKFACGHPNHWVEPDHYKAGRGCPLCTKKGEAALHNLLLSIFDKVDVQKKYEGLRDKHPLYYDFYIPEYNLLIELDGEHHRKEVAYKTKDMSDKEKDMADIDAFLKFKDRQYKDKLKDDYAKANNIPLLRIEYSKGRVELDKWKNLILDKISDIENLS